MNKHIEEIRKSKEFESKLISERKYKELEGEKNDNKIKKRNEIKDYTFLNQSSNSSVKN